MLSQPCPTYTAQGEDQSSPRKEEKPAKPFPEDKHATRPTCLSTQPRTRSLLRAQEPRTHLGLSQRLFLALHLRPQDFAEQRNQLLPGLRGNINFLRIKESVRHSAVGPVFCGVLRNTNPWILPVLNSHHSVVRLVVVEYCCVIYLFMTLAVHGTDSTIGTFNQPV